MKRIGLDDETYARLLQLKRVFAVRDGRDYGFAEVVSELIDFWEQSRITRSRIVFEDDERRE